MEFDYVFDNRSKSWRKAAYKSEQYSGYCFLGLLANLPVGSCKLYACWHTGKPSTTLYCIGTPPKPK